ncbi:MAG: hypothetical protein ACYC9X_00645 [Dehalococcoidia bacterium]
METSRWSRREFIPVANAAKPREAEAVKAAVPASEEVRNYALTIRRAGKECLVVGLRLAGSGEAISERVLFRSDGISACEEEIYRIAVRWFSFHEAEEDMREG